MNTPSPTKKVNTPRGPSTKAGPASPPSPPDRQSEFGSGDHPVVKFVMIGDNGVGKSNLALRFCKGEFNRDSTHTVGFEFRSRPIAITNALTVAAQIWDTAGQERFHSLTGAYMRGAVGIYLVYDVTKRSSFENLPRWIEKINEHSHPNAVRSLIGNKLDLLSKRQVSTLEALAFAKQNSLDFCEVSASSGENVEIALRRLVVTVGNSLIEHDERLSLPNLEVNSSLLLDLDDARGEIGGEGAGGGGFPRPTLSKLPRGWVEVKDGKEFENVWTGERERERPKKAASKGELNYSRPQSELEKINVSFAGIEVGKKKKRKKKGAKTDQERRTISRDDEGGMSFGLHGSLSQGVDNTCGSGCTLS